MFRKSYRLVFVKKLLAIALISLCLAVPARAQSDAPAPFDADLARLSEILGALHYLRAVCGANDGAKWRNEMQALLELIDAQFARAPDAELSLEVDPRRVEAGRLGRLGQETRFLGRHQPPSPTPYQPVGQTEGAEHAEIAENGELHINWPDGHKSIYTPYHLRVNCRCAHCIDEETGLKTLDDAEVPLDVTINGINQVGRYAIAIAFSDGHNTGIYTFKRLRELCECPEHSKKGESFSV